MGPRGVPTYPIGIAERWHRNRPSLAKERNPAYYFLYHCLLISWLILLCKLRKLYGAPKRTVRYLVTVLYIVRDDLLLMSPNLGQHPPFFSKMRTFFKNRPAWYQLYRNSAVYHGGRFLTHPKTKKVFFPRRDSQSDR
jgi:hypothetical protein